MDPAPYSSCAVCGARLVHPGRGVAALDVTVASTDGDPFEILKSITLSLAPGSSTAVLTSAGAGGTTLLRTLAHRLATPGAPRRRFDDAPLWKSGTACGASAASALVAEHDTHEPHQTVREVLALVHACAYAAQEADSETDTPPPPCAGCDRLVPAAVVAALGLESALSVRTESLSGGQRRRLTVAEVFVGAAGGAERRAPFLLFDCAAAGLDSGSAARLLTFARMRARATGGVLVATLKAPEPELLDIFERVLVLADGRILFHGPLDAAAPFIERVLGATRSARVSLPVFLCAIASDGTLLADAWAASDEAVADRVAATAMCDDTAAAPTSEGPPPPRDALAQFRVLLPVALLRVARDQTVVGARIGSTAIFGAILGWLSSAAAAGQTNPAWRFGIFLFAPIFMAFLSQSELPGFYISRAVVYRQTMTARLSVGAWVSAAVLAALPLVVFSAIVFSSLIYWPGQFAIEFDRYLFFLLTLIVFERAVASTFRAVAASFALLTTAQALFVVVINAFLLWSGFYIIRSEMPVWLAWGCFISPAWWTVEALSTNEFRAPVYAGSDTGATTLAAFDFINSDVAKWGGIIFLVLLALALSVCLTFTLHTRKIDCILAHRGAVRRVRALLDGTPPPPTPLPCEPLRVDVAGISFTIKTPVGTKVLIQNITATLLPGTITALIGASGAGKTTLLDVLAHRKAKTSGVVRGDFFLNGVAVPYDALGARARFAQQFDSHFPLATVREAFAFSSLLRLADLRGANELDARADAIAATLGLDPARLVATLSQGEAKRLTIGVELAAEGSLLFADEPTTGLQSNEAADVMAAVVRVAATGRTCVVTLHQPPRDVFLLCTHAIVLAPGGTLAYAGPLGADAADLIASMEARGGLPCGDKNPARWAIEVAASVERFAMSPLQTNGVVSIAGGIAGGVADAASLSASEAGSTTATSEQPTAAPLARVRPLRSTAVQFSALCKRAARERVRNTGVLFARGATVLFLALVLGLLFTTRPPVSFSLTRSIVGYCIAGPALLAIVYMQTAAVSAAERAPARDREIASAAYAPFLYSVTATFIEVPELAFASLVFAAIAYTMAGLAITAAHFFFFTLGVAVLSWALVSIAQALVNLTPNLAAAQILTGLIISLCFLFSGLFLPPASLPSFWTGLYYAVPTSHILRALSNAQFYCVPLISASCPTIVVAGVTVPRYTYVLELLNLPLDNTTMWRFDDFGYASLATLVGAVIAAVALEVRSRL